MSTELQFSIPASLDLDSSTPPAVPLRASFVARGYRVNVVLTPRTGDRGPFDSAFTSIACFVSGFAEPDADLDAIADDPPALLEFVTRCTNRVLTALRNSGLLHSARPLPRDWGISDPATALHSLSLARRDSVEGS